MTKLRLFNIDLHYSVIRDIKHILNDLYGDNIEVSDIALSNHTWAPIGSYNYIPTDVINGHTWNNINIDMINRFVERYRDLLQTFDGFIVTHSPIFCLLYETFNKPIILINSCRYEQPFSFKNDIDMWNYLNVKLKEMHDKKQLVVVSNNKADHHYLKHGTGIESHIIPSLCLYTKSTYMPIYNKYIINTNHNIPETETVVNKRNCLHSGYQWQELYSYKGIIHMPYEISTMSIFEHYSANVPLFFPSKTYLTHLLQYNNYSMWTRYTRLQIHSAHPPQLDVCLNDNTWIDFWINKSDFYDEENMKHIVYFDSNEHLFELLNTVDTNDISSKMKEHNISRKSAVYDSWKRIFDETFGVN